MNTAYTYLTVPTQFKKAVHTVAQQAIALKATTAAICGAAQKRWSIEWK